MKTVTSKERKKGHWKYVTVTDDGYYLRVTCSVCESRFNPLTGAKHYKYCPECGAKMEEEE